MPTFEPFTVAAAPFPYVERPIVKRRPCLVIGRPETAGLLWVLMITSARNEPWPGDVAISDLQGAGLAHASVVRTAKIATVEAGLLSPIGTLTKAGDRKSISQALARTLGGAL